MEKNKYDCHYCEDNGFIEELDITSCCDYCCGHRYDYRGMCANCGNENFSGEYAEYINIEGE